MTKLKLYPSMNTAERQAHHLGRIADALERLANVIEKAENAPAETICDWDGNTVRTVDLTEPKEQP